MLFKRGSTSSLPREGSVVAAWMVAEKPTQALPRNQLAADFGIQMAVRRCCLSSCNAVVGFLPPSATLVRPTVVILIVVLIV